jgi:hypothetical protein
MATRFYLNALRKAERQLANPRAGSWNDDSISKDFLAKFAADILVDGEIADPGVAHSVPSVFARPILFHQALSDSESPLHKAILNEWRGLLAIFGLQAWYGFKVRVERYDVPAADPAATSQVGSVGLGDLHLRTMLRQQLPEPQFQSQSDWDRWWLIYCDDKLIGATSPWTMVYTPARYQAPMGIPWSRDGILRDPITHFDPRGTGSSLELALLLRWAALVLEGRDEKWGMGDHLEDKAKVVAEQLEAWHKALSRYARRDVVIEQLAAYPTIPDPPYSRFLLFAPDASLPTAKSDLLLKSKRLGDRDVLALSRSKLSPGDRVWKSVLVEQLDLARLSRSTGDKIVTRGGQEHQVPYVFPEEAFFPPKLVELPLTDAAMDRGSTRLSLPLTPAFFEYFDLQDLVDQRDMLRVMETDQSVMVTLRLPLTESRTLTVEKTYDRATDVLRWEAPIPAFAVWPDFCADDWKENFAAYAAPVDPSKPDFRVAPLLANRTTLDASVNDGSQRPVRIWRCVAPPIGFLLTHRNPGSNETFQVGLLLRKELVRPAKIEPTRTWHVAVDFGTSSTTVMVRKNSPETELLPLVGRTKFLTVGTGDLMDAIRDNLYPAEGAKPPFPTLLYQNDATVIGGDSGGYTLRFVYYPGERAQPVPNVKWGTHGGKAEQEQLKQYLEGLIRYIVADARCNGVGTLEFRWSYPLALPTNVVQAMKDFWTSVAATYTRGGSLSVSVAEPVSESEAICRALAALESSVLEIRAETLSVAVDMGGGSTDVGFWSERNLLDQLSCKLGANDVLDPRWTPLPEFLPQFEQFCGAAQTSERVRRSVADRASIYFNHLLTQAREDSGEVYTGLNPAAHPVPLRMHKHGAQAPPWLYLRTMAYLFFCGMAYYIGLHSGKLRSGINVSGIKVYFGGRGASLLTWLTSDIKKLRAILCDVFEQGAIRASGESAKIAVEFLGPAIKFASNLPAPKREVALGLLCEPLGGNVKKKPTTAVGEVHWKHPDGIEVAWSAEVTAEELAKLRPPVGLDDSFAAFLLDKILPKYTEINLDLEGLGRLKLETGKIQECIRRSAEVSEQVLQPVFACELKVLMDQYLDLVLNG